MARFWFLLGVAFFDLILAVVLVGWGYRSAAFLFLLMGALLGGYALFSVPTTTRDARGRLRSVEFPYSTLLGTVGAIAILVSAVYVATATTQPRAAKESPPPASEVVVRPVATEPPYQSPRSFNPAASTAALYKCVDGKQHSSFQSQPCPAGSEQVWVRDATPETPSRRTQRYVYSSPSPRASNSPGSSSAGASNPSASPACRAARAADAAYRAQPLSRVKHDGLRWHGDRIREACY
jgi:hypothetical protein